ncbi:MAG TPA: nucleotide exchange factor GrpE [Gemmatimonadota bacterium]|nr:nucleotide exchange factor GrpE [Gemmatimonadota bacterium]
MTPHEEPREIPIEDPEAGPGAADERQLAEESASEAGAIATEDLEVEIEAELAGLQDRFLRLQAEFDNYKKREARERSAAWARAKGDLVQKLLGTLDDLERVTRLDPEKTPASAVIDGVSLLERKLVDTLEREGLTRIGEVGEPFDPHRHEAISTLPAPSTEQDGTVANVAIPGYAFGSQLLRPAQVQVYEHRSDRS